VDVIEPNIVPLVRWLRRSSAEAQAEPARPSDLVRDGIRYDLTAAEYHYLPWTHEESFLQIYRKAAAFQGPYWEGFEPRAYIVIKAVELAATIPGCYVECGVYTGGTALLIAEARDRSGSPEVLHLFDTFTGTPIEGLTPAEQALAGQHGDTSLVETKKRLAAYANLTFHQGSVPAILAGFDAPVSFLHVDINTGVAHKAVVKHFWPLLTNGAVVLFDDYGWPGHAQSKRAVDQYLDARVFPRPISLATGQALYVHRWPSARAGSF
jgi:hypothetical protein